MLYYSLLHITQSYHIITRKYMYLFLKVVWSLFDRT